jgi:hypothetical protein
LEATDEESHSIGGADVRAGLRGDGAGLLADAGTAASADSRTDCNINVRNQRSTRMNIDWMSLIMAFLQALPTIIPQVIQIIDAIIAIFNQNPTPANAPTVAFLQSIRSHVSTIPPKKP